MLKAYQWVIDNQSYQNLRVVEAWYTVGTHIAKGKDNQTPEKMRTMAETLWKELVNTSMDFGSKSFKKNFRPWVRKEEVRDYIQAAILQAGEAYGELGEHATAAEIFSTYLTLYRPGAGPGDIGFIRSGRQGAIVTVQ